MSLLATGQSNVSMKYPFIDTFSVWPSDQRIVNSSREFSPADRRALDDLGHWVEQVFRYRDLGKAQRQTLLELGETRRNSLLAILPNCQPEQLAQLETRLRRSLELPFIIGDDCLELNYRIGHASADYRHSTPEVAQLLDSCREGLK